MVAGAACAQSPESLAWLRKIQDATRNLSYTGTFVYQQGNRNETSRITRLAPADIERLEVLDGLPRELVRTRDTVRCYLPESKVVKVERRTPDRSFPALLPDQVNALAQHYDIALGETQRTGLASLGAIHIYTRQVANHMVTVVGEAPAASVQRIGNAVEYRRP